ncbi:molecular chaperone DnaK [Noviherbaspirillum cavernae]|uniref:Molecular chaperone DnaK n=2 Tax=Noviherbaspirillum cavernae TaxID=2320862 RepID=A0A418WV79_9BURK|nr:Hsp70 family protein [Noviherbaspirillum cavernae]RJF96461.1 molecular chaperone DnaK [Noviherbaspirillum cavernae]
MKRYAVGIDLGTTNTVVAYADARASDGADAGSDEVRLFEIEQLVALGEVKAAPLLPSLRYHPASGELVSDDLRLPWSAGGDTENVVIGRLARKLGAQVPGRLVASAKSWLSHAAVDRLAPILPWGAADDVAKISPVDASASYLAHVRAAWNMHFPHAPLELQDIVLTVPASFDEGARALTVKAAAQAGLPTLRLLEEPQAAFYDWLFRHRQTLDAELAQTRLILVCDVGGGTTDFSLITVALRDGEPQLTPELTPELTRIGVGKHLMLGGDNMDLVLAHIAESRMAGEEGAARLSAGALSQLMERCRAAKEQLLAANAPDKTTVTLLGAGARVIGGARSVELTRDEVERTIVDGFFPMVAADEPARQRRSGIVEFGLPYASDAAVTRHLAGFLMQHATSEGALPDTLLLNGGVFRADALARRLQDTLAKWRGAPLRLLHNDNPDVAVARGAVAYTLARKGLAPRIGGGSPRSYFLMLEASSDAEKDVPQRAICILPRGSDEGHEILLTDRVFALRVGQPVRFHLISSTADAINQTAPRLGDIVDLAHGDFARLPPIATALQADTAGGKQDIPVQLATALTEVGTLEMHCVSTTDPSRRWLLEFQLRDRDAQAEQDEQQYALPPRFADAAAQIDRIFGTRAQKVQAKEVTQLRTRLEKLLGSRERWHTPLLRKLFDLLWERAKGRRRSAEHERLWLNLIGYCLRPGFGYPLDDWRIAQLWPLYETGVQYGNDSRVNAEWWTLWRRVAGGLQQEAQLRLLNDFAFNVQGSEEDSGPRPTTLASGSEDDMLRLVASLERIPAGYKSEIGAWLFERLQQSPSVDKDALAGRILWATGRIGARQPFYGSAHDVVPPEVGAEWLTAILALNWKRNEAAAFAAAYLARMTGDRARDLPLELREQVIQRLAAAGAPAIWIAMVREPMQLDEASERLVLGESLPPGLKLIA